MVFLLATFCMTSGMPKSANGSINYRSKVNEIEILFEDALAGYKYGNGAEAKVKIQAAYFEVYEEFEDKFENVKNKRGVSHEFLKQLKKMWDYLSSGDDLTVKAMIIGGLFYFISPIDLIPDFIPVAGFLDDIAVIAGIFAAVKSKMSD